MQSSSQIITTNKPTSSFFTGRMPFLTPSQQFQSTEGKSITFHGLAYPKLTWGLSTLCLTTNSSWLPYLGKGCHVCHQPSDASTQKERSRYDIRKFFFSSRVVNNWNSLPNNVISAKTINCFKSKFRSTLAKPGRQIGFSSSNHWKRKPAQYVTS